jgi:hypothetical protein
MTRKDFQAIATVIKDTPFTDPQDRVILAHRMAEVCQTTNPNLQGRRSNGIVAITQKIKQ